MSRDWRESEHPRRPSGDEHGGEFTHGWAVQVAQRLAGWQPMTRGELHAAVMSGTQLVGRIHGGQMAETQLARHPGGVLSVHKTYPAILADRAENEQAVSLVAEAIGAPYPPVVVDPQDPHAIFMQFIDHDQAASSKAASKQYSHLLRTDDALLLGFLDVLTANGDRNNGNVIVLTDQDNRMVGIDGGEAFLNSHGYDGDGTARPPGFRVPGFTPRFTKTSPWLGRVEWRDNDLSPGDFEAARPRLQSLRRVFDQLGMDRAHGLMMERFEAMAGYATGTERKLPI